LTCTRCGAENETGRKFCGECGAPLALLCPSCGSPNPPTVKFCGECGSSLAGAAPPAEAAREAPLQASGLLATEEAGTERRLVSVLFADLVGFTTLSEERDSEEVRDLLSSYFDTCRTVVERYGGTVEKFIGDAVMAVWGTPVAQEDDAERSVRAAIDVVDAVAQMGEDVGAPGLRARAGVLTGEATVTLGARGQGMVAGDLVNTASRVQTAAEPGTVLVGDSTKRASDAGIVYADTGTHSLKGKAEPIQLWRAVRVVAGRGGLMKSEGLEAPFVGRDRELKLVKDLFHACVDEGKAHLIQVTGIAGIGKSRLGWEFFKYMDGIERLFFWHRGRCLAYGEGVTYWALAEMVRGRAGIVEGEERVSALAKLHAAVEQYVPDPEDRRFVEPRLAHLVGLEDRTAPDRSDLFAGWRLFFERLSEQDPVVMLFEDLQWADASLLEFIDHLLEWSRAFPIFVMTLARPGAETTSLAGPKRNATSIYLEPLPASAMERLLGGLVPGLPEELTAKILDRAEGVPLYAVETVRMLLDRGLLVQEGAVYRPAAAVEDLEVPETLQALIAARLDGLGPDERRLVQDASVLGKTFTRAALAALSGLPERDLEPLLASLVAKEVLSVQADPRSPERGQYGFLQDLVRTVAYETLSKRDRKAKHLRVAEYLERAWGEDEEEIVEVVASHYVEAYELAPDADDAGEIRGRARGMLARAAERAASLAAAREAEAYFMQAAELADSGPERAELVERAGQMAILRGRTDEAAERFAAAAALFEEAGLTHPAARLQARLGEVDFIDDRLDQAIERLRAAHLALSTDEPDRDRAEVAAQLGRFLSLGTGLDEATAFLEEALELAEHFQLPEIYSNALSSRAIGLLRVARLDEAAHLLRRALEVALEHDLPRAALRAYNNLSVVWESLDRFAEVIELGDQAMGLSRRSGDRANELACLVGTLGDYVATGRWDEAVARAAEAEATEELGALKWVAAGLLELAPLQAYRGELDAARELVDRFDDLGTSGNEELRAMHRVVLADVLLQEGRADEALAAADEVVGLRGRFGLTSANVKRGLVIAVQAALAVGNVAKAEELLGIVEGARPGLVTPYLRINGARLAARVAAARADHDAVEPGFAAAEAGFRELGTPFDLAVVLLEHAEWLASRGRDAEAEPLVSEAREVFDGLGAKPWLDRAAAVGAGAEARVPGG
jgi:class 3 adenylate cyclase/tetratricopeptide (TPR) repeat protein